LLRKAVSIVAYACVTLASVNTGVLHMIPPFSQWHVANVPVDAVDGYINATSYECTRGTAL